jgi:hypothetical protein
MKTENTAPKRQLTFAEELSQVIMRVETMASDWDLSAYMRGALAGSKPLR